jgi:hypothetical protein
MEVVLRDSSRTADWDAYLGSHAEGTIFHLSKWEGAVVQTFGHRSMPLWALEGNAPIGVLPLYVVHTLKGKALVSVPYAVYGGVVADRADVAHALLDAARALAGPVPWADVPETINASATAAIAVARSHPGTDKGLHMVSPSGGGVSDP